MPKPGDFFRAPDLEDRIVFEVVLHSASDVVQCKQELEENGIGWEEARLLGHFAVVLDESELAEEWLKVTDVVAGQIMDGRVSAEV